MEQGDNKSTIKSPCNALSPTTDKSLLIRPEADSEGWVCWRKEGSDFDRVRLWQKGDSESSILLL